MSSSSNDAAEADAAGQPETDPNPSPPVKRQATASADDKPTKRRGGNRKNTAYAKRQDGLDGKQVSDGGIKGDPKAKRPRLTPSQSGRKAKGRPGMSPQEIKKCRIKTEASKNPKQS